MKNATMSPETRCKSCGELVSRPISRVAMCPHCLLRAGRTPERNPAPSSATTTWSEVFPQLEIESTLRESDEDAAFLVRILNEKSPDERAVLQVVSGAAFEAAGGTDALTAHAQRLAATRIDGMARVLDFGDVVDAFFLVTSSSGLAVLPEAMAEQSAEELTATLPEILDGAEAIVKAAREEHIPLRVTAETSFVDFETGQIVLTPPLLVDESTGATLLPAITRLEPGLRLGAFILEEKRGEGGFGEVWRARQERPVKRTVALKILKTGMTSPRLQARFDVEQQALSRIEHPNVARYVDGGITADARPYFAMEWIEGSSLTRFCTEENTSLDDRLGLFLEVCAAIQHAHQKGIIHRDLKPSNVMVTDIEGTPVVKVIDFGIARSLEAPLADQTLLTRHEEVLGTPVYLSPEQAAGAGGADLDARTDVYGLGVLLYELLTGALPFDKDLPPDELRRRIREDDPLRPSDRTEEKTTARELRGDLDWIVMTCLEKDPERRYASVSALARDLDRYFAQEPVEAGPPAVTYRMRKFVRRNRALVSGAAVAIGALLVGLLLAIAGFQQAKEKEQAAREAEAMAQDQLRESEEARKEAQAMANLFHILITTPKPLDDLSEANRDITVVEALEQVAEQLDERLEEHPVRKAQMQLSLGTSFWNLGYPLKAIPILEAAVESLTRLIGREHELTLGAMNSLAISYDQVGREDEALVLYEQILPVREKLNDPLAADTLAAFKNLANAYANSGEPEKALALSERRFATLKLGYGAADPRTLEAMAFLAMSHHRAGNSAKGIQLIEESARIAEENLGPGHETTIELLQAYGGAPLPGDRKCQILVRTLDLAREHLGIEHRLTLDTMIELGVTYRGLHQLEKARVILEEALREQRRVFGLDHSELIIGTQYLASVHNELKDYEKAASYQQEAVRLVRAHWSEAHPDLITDTHNLGHYLWMSGRYKESLLTIKEAYELALEHADENRAERVLRIFFAPPGFRRNGEFAYHHSIVALEQKNLEAARPLFLLSLAAEISAEGAQFEIGRISRLIRKRFERDPELAPVILGSATGRTWESRELLSKKSEWKYFIPPNEGAPSFDWTSPAFDDSDWETGVAPVGYGDEVITTDVAPDSETGEKPLTLYLRRELDGADITSLQAVLCSLLADDGAAIYLNGVEVSRVRLPEGPLLPSTLAEKGKETFEELKLDPNDFHAGTNVLAIEVHQTSATSSDLIFDMELTGYPWFPDADFITELLANFSEAEEAATFAKLKEEAFFDLEPLPADWRKHVGGEVRDEERQ